MMNTGTVAAAALGWRGRSWAYTGQPGTRERWNQVTSGPITRGWYMVEFDSVTTNTSEDYTLHTIFNWPFLLLTACCCWTTRRRPQQCTTSTYSMVVAAPCDVYLDYTIYFTLLLRTETRRGWLTSKTIELIYIYIFYWSLRGPSCCFFMILISISRCLLPWSEHPLSFLCLTILLKLEPASLSLRRGFSK